MNEDQFWKIIAKACRSEIHHADCRFRIVLALFIVGCMQVSCFPDEVNADQVADGVIAYNKPFTGHKQSVNCVCFTPDGKFVLSGSDDWTARLWEVQTGKEVRSCNSKLPIFDVVCSADGQVVFTSSTVAVGAWDFKTFKSLGFHSAGMTANWGIQLTIANEDRVFAAGTRGDKCYLSYIDWKKEPNSKGEAAFTLLPACYFAACSPEDKQIACGDDYGKIAVWKHPGVQNQRFFHGHEGGIRRLTFSKNGKLLLSGAMDKTARLWKVVTGEQIHVLRGHTGWVTAVAFSPDGSLALTGSSDRTIRLWDLKTGKELCHFEGHGDLVTSVAFSPDGKVAASASDDCTVRLWDLAARKSVVSEKPKVEVGELKRVEGYTEPVFAALVSATSEFVLFRSKKGTVTLWDVAKDQLAGKIEPKDGLIPVRLEQPNAIWALSADGKLLLACGSDQTVRLWDLKSGQVLRTFTIPVVWKKLPMHNWVSALAFSPDGKFALAGTRGGALHLLDNTTGQAIRSFYYHADMVQAIAFSKDGRLAVSSSGQGFKLEEFNTVRVWDVRTGKEHCCFQGHRDLVESVDFSPDGRHVLSCAWDQTAKLWDIDTKKMTRTLFWDESFAFTHVRFSPDGKRAVICGMFGVELRDVSSGKSLASFKKPRTGLVMSAGFSADGQQAVSIGYDRVIRVWALPKEKKGNE